MTDIKRIKLSSMAKDNVMNFSKISDTSFQVNITADNEIVDGSYFACMDHVNNPTKYPIISNACHVLDFDVNYVGVSFIKDQEGIYEAKMILCKDYHLKEIEEGKLRCKDHQILTRYLITSDNNKAKLTLSLPFEEEILLEYDIKRSMFNNNRPLEVDTTESVTGFSQHVSFGPNDRGMSCFYNDPNYNVGYVNTDILLLRSAITERNKFLQIKFKFDQNYKAETISFLVNFLKTLTGQNIWFFSK